MRITRHDRARLRVLGLGFKVWGGLGFDEEGDDNSLTGGAMEAPLVHTAHLGVQRTQRKHPLSLTAAAQDARALLERSIRASALARVRMEDAERARDQLEEAIRRRRELSEEIWTISCRMCGAAAQVARLAREAGTPPERMVILLKDIVESNGLEPKLEQELERQIVEWGIVGYYDAA